MNLSLSKKRDGWVCFWFVFCVFVLACCVFFYSYNLNSKRIAFSEYVRNQKAYYMARAGAEHFTLKLKTLNRRYPETIKFIENVPENRKNLFNSFKEDVIIPSDSVLSGKYYRYGVDGFAFIKNGDSQNAPFTLQIDAYGSFDDCETTLRRYVRIDR